MREAVLLIDLGIGSWGHRINRNYDGDGFLSYVTTQICPHGQTE